MYVDFLMIVSHGMIAAKREGECFFDALSFSAVIIFSRDFTFIRAEHQAISLSVRTAILCISMGKIFYAFEQQTSQQKINEQK